MVWQQRAHQSMACLVIGHQLLGGAVGHSPALEASDDSVSCVVDLLHGDASLVAPRRQDGRLVHEILEICSAEASRALGDVQKRHLFCQLLVLHMHIQDLLPALHIWQTHGDPAVETTRPQQGLVQDVRTIGGSNYNDAAVAFKAIHLSEDLVQGLLALVIAASHAGAALSADGVELVDEDDARRLLLGLLEDVANPRGTHAHEELNEL
mmetsp:Transcript_42820/g.102057  ORF Transcript_42820/g.102057 Transcript_42820/m.102057 type:complete len:209 (-) Transcript_42820:1220-1846(-)